MSIWDCTKEQEIQDQFIEIVWGSRTSLESHVIQDWIGEQEIQDQTLKIM